MPRHYGANINSGKYPTADYTARKSILYIWLLRLCCCAPCPKIAKNVEDDYESDSSNSQIPSYESDSD